MTVEPQATVIARLALHQSQRAQSVPTLSVLIGQVIVARQLWMRWLNAEQRPAAVSVYKSSRALLEVWLSAIAQHEDVRSRVLQKVALLANQPADQLAAWLGNTSAYQLQLFWQRLLPLSAEVPLLRSLLAAWPLSTFSETYADQGANQWLQSQDAATIINSFITLARLLPASSVPGLLVLLPEDDAPPATATTLGFLTQLVEAVPAIPVGLLLTTDRLQDLLIELPASRVKAILSSGLIEVPSLESAGLRQWLSDRGVTAEACLQPMLQLVDQNGTTSELLETALALVDPASQPKTAEADTVYRSQAEKFLFQYLEARPTTAGRFRVNARLDFNFGNRRMEVDFLDMDTKTVIELDGHYHFKSLDHYRRDRRKDRILQQHGFLVLRFLSEDVVRDLEEILDAVDQTLNSRKSLIKKTLET